MSELIRNDVVPSPQHYRPESGYPGVPAAAAANSGQRGGSEGITVGQVWRAAQLWWKIALPCGLLLATLGALVVWSYFEPLYKATAWLQIKQRSEYLAFPLSVDERFVRNQLGLLRSPLVLERVLVDPEVAHLPELTGRSQPIEWLKQSIGAAPIAESDYFEVSFTSPNPQNAKKLLDAIVTAYLKVYDENSQAQTERVVQLLHEEKKNRAADVQDLQENVRRLAKELHQSESPILGQDRVVVTARTPVHSLQDRLAAAEVNREVAKAELKAMESMHSAPVDVPEVEVNGYLDSLPEMQMLMHQIQTKRSRIQQLEDVVAPGYRDTAIRRIELEVEADEQRLAALRDELRPQVAKLVEEDLRAARNDELKAKQRELDNLQVMENILREQLKRELSQQVYTGDQYMELEFARAELERGQNVLDRIADRILAITTETRAPSPVQLIAQLPAPREPTQSVPYSRITAASLAGIAFPFLIAVIWERGVRRVVDPEQLLEHTRLPVVAEVTSLPARRITSARRALLRSREREVFKESIDSLRTTLVLTEELKNMRVLAVVSAVSREGKTSLASHLAVSLARATEQPVLLVDADMRSPDLHTIFETPLEPGLCNVLDGQITANEAVQATASPHLHLLPAGKLHRSPHRLLSGSALETLLTELKQQYRYVVIDTPPVLPASESLVFAKAAEGVLFCAMREVSKSQQVQTAYQRLVASGAQPLGVVLNGVPARAYATKYGSYAYPAA